jgi:pimeloyl-ACP methyl ester carboxylesterase
MKATRITLAGAIAALALIASVSHTAEAQSAPPFETGEFTVPAVRGDAASTVWTLRYMRFRSTSATPGAPIVFLAGGPGDAGTRAVAGMPRQLLDRLLAIADVVAFDQRGTGQSDPRGATCPPAAPQPLDRPFDAAAWASAQRARLESCIPALAARGIPAAGFTTRESADDVAALRAALGVPKVTLWAGSYGTHLALAVARRHPDAVDRMVLFGVEGPDDTLKRPALVDDVLANIDRAHPGVVANVQTLLRRLREQPWTKVLPNGQAVTVGAWDLQRRVADALDTVAEIEALPAALAGMLGGDYSDLVRFAIPFRATAPINLMHVAMDCASFASPSRLTAVRDEAARSLLGDAINAPLPDICETPGLPRLDEAFRAPIVSKVPTLFVAGTFDGRTPPANLDAFRQSFARGEFLVIPGASHSLFRESAAMEAAMRFFAAVL